MSVPDSVYDDLGRQYSEALAIAARDTLWNLRTAVLAGWTNEEFRHWVATGERLLAGRA